MQPDTKATGRPNSEASSPSRSTASLVTADASPVASTAATSVSSSDASDADDKRSTTDTSETSSDFDGDVAPYSHEYPEKLPRVPSGGEVTLLDVDQKTPDHWVQRDERMIRLTGKHPYNCEPPLTDLWNCGFLTPSSLFYVRSHGATPRVTEDEATSWRLRIHGLVKKEISFTIAELKEKFETVTLPVTLVCAGNRRKEQNIVAKGLGFGWGSAGVSTGLFTGVYLADILAYCQPKRPLGSWPWHADTPGRARHVIFEGTDELPNGKYGTSQRLVNCMDRNKGMLIAWGMNGEALSPDHGFPLRLVCPGQIGGRMVKWLNRIEVSDRESQHYLHFRDNKVLPTQVSADEARKEEHWWKDPKYIIYDLNVNGAIAQPAHDETITLEEQDDGCYDVQGYAYTGGGKRIARAEISLDDGDSWHLAELDFPEDLYRLNPIRNHPYFGTLDLTQTEMSFAWCFWKLRVPVTKLKQASVIMLRVHDEGLAQMPRDMYWNATGMMNSWFHRIAVHYDAQTRQMRFEHPTIAGNTDGGWMQRLKAEGQDIRSPHFSTKTTSTVKAALPAPLDVKKVDDMEIMTDPQKMAVRISAAQLAEHATEENPWFVVNGHVFDGTGFLDEHPGGAESITLVAGDDATEDFMAIHSMDAKKKMRPFHVGTLDSVETKKEEESHEDPLITPWLHPKKWKLSKLVAKTVVSSDSRIFRFALDHPEQEAGLPIGQHVYLRLKGKDGEMVQRAYTPFSNNELKGFIDILIKVYSPSGAYPEGGRMTNLIENLKVGEDSVELKGPLGSFTYLGNGQVKWKGKQRRVRNVACIAGGSGITPIWSTLKGIVDDGPNSDVNVYIIDANRSESDILARTHLDQVVEQSNGRIKLWHILSGETPPSWSMGRGRVSQQLLGEKLCPPPAAPSTADELEDTLALVCGPPAMEKVVADGLKALGWDLERTVVFF